MSDTPADKEQIRAQVAKDYTAAVTRKAKGCCDGKPAPQGVAAKWAGYSAEELASLPAEARLHSFGCGNPLAFSDVQPGQTVLDLGSGAGIDLILAARRVGPHGKVIGVDMTGAMLDQARQNIAAAKLRNVEVRQGLIEKLPLADNAVDWVISNCVINLSPDKPAVFREIFRVLTPGGRMQVSDLVVEDLPPELRHNPTLYSSCISGAISENEYLQEVRNAGLIEVEVRERLVYQEPQIKDLLGSELRLSEGGAQESGALAARYAAMLAGRVASLKIAARKPRCACGANR